MPDCQLPLLSDAPQFSDMSQAPSIATYRGSAFLNLNLFGAYFIGSMLSLPDNERMRDLKDEEDDLVFFRLRDGFEDTADGALVNSGRFDDEFVREESGDVAVDDWTDESDEDADESVLRERSEKPIV